MQDSHSMIANQRLRAHIWRNPDVPLAAEVMETRRTNAANIPFVWRWLATSTRGEIAAILFIAGLFLALVMPQIPWGK